ncbi:carbohydrate-binding module family 13 protein, partial [Macrolepiota fuliginosa MF-IS2]
LHPDGNTEKCLDVRDANFTNGTAVQIFDCNGTPGQQRVLQVGETHVRVANTGFCLDTGASAPINGTPMKTWTCFNNLPAQDWLYTGDDRIALINQG